IINDCIYRAWRPGNCDQTLNNVGNLIASQSFQNDLIETLVRIVARGRQSEGASPPESFQVYIAGYVQFWNHDDPGCDDVSWGWWPWDKPKITTTLRRRMNDLVNQINGVIES